MTRALLAMALIAVLTAGAAYQHQRARMAELRATLASEGRDHAHAQLGAALDSVTRLGDRLERIERAQREHRRSIDLIREQTRAHQHRIEREQDDGCLDRRLPDVLLRPPANAALPAASAARMPGAGSFGASAAARSDGHHVPRRADRA